MSTLSDARRLGTVQEGGNGDDFIFVNSRNGNKVPVLIGNGGNDTLRGDGGGGIFIGGNGNDHLSAGAAFAPTIDTNFKGAGKAHAYYGGAGRDTIEAGEDSYVNGKGTAAGNSVNMPQDADVFIFHQMGPRDYAKVTRISDVDLGLDRAHLQSKTFTVTAVTGDSISGGRFLVDHVIIKGPAVAKGGGGEWLDIDFDDRRPLIIPRGEDHKDFVHDLLDADLFNL